MTRDRPTAEETTELERTAHFNAIGNEYGIEREPGEDDVVYGERIHAALDEMIGELLQYQHELQSLLADCDECE